MATTDAILFGGVDMDTQERFGAYTWIHGGVGIVWDVRRWTDYRPNILDTHLGLAKSNWIENAAAHRARRR